MAKKPYTGELPKKTVRKGDVNDDVSKLKLFLNWCVGTKFKGGKTFGVKTEEAVKKFQSRYSKEFGLDVDGIFGKECRKAAKAIVARHESKEAKLRREIRENCIKQAEWMKDAEYDWGDWNPKNVKQSAKAGTCVTYVACVLQRMGYLKSGQYIWHNGRGYGDGKVYGTNDKMTTTYMHNKPFKDLKSKLKRGDIILVDDNKSGKSGSGGHIMILDRFEGDTPYVWDNFSGQSEKYQFHSHAYGEGRRVLARVRLKVR